MDEPSTSQSPSAQTAANEKPPDESRLVRTRKACLACRAIKAKCIECDIPAQAPPAEGGPHACKRCARLHIPCKFEVDKRTQRHQRPRKAVPAHVQQPQDLQNPIFMNSFATSSTSPVVQTHIQHFDMHQYPSQQALQTSVPQQQQISPSLGIQQYSLPSSSHLPNGQHPSPNSPGRPMRSAGDYATLVEAVDATVQSSKKRPRDTDPDPLSMSILNMAEAASLVSHFHNKLGPFLNMFDPAIVTAESLQQESAVLFSAVLSTAAKFYRPDIYKALLQHAKQLVTRRLLAARYDIHLLQSLLLLAHWREVADASAFVNVGAAIRMGYQLELHTSHSIPQHNTEDPLMQLNRQRTWLQLICYDTTYRLRSKTSRSPSMIPLDLFPEDPSQWLNEGSSASDKQLVFSVELTRTVRIIEDGLSSDSASDTAVSYFVSLFERFRLKWVDGAIQWDVLRDAKCRWAYWYMGFKLHISTATNERFERSLGPLLSAAENTVSAALKLFALDMIDYLPDSNAFQILYIGERLSMLHEILQPELKEKLAGWMQQIHSAANVSVVSGKGEGLPSYFVARYFDILLQEMQKPGSRQNTRPPSRAQSPAAAPMPLDLGNAADLSNNVSAWLNGSDFDIFGGVMQFETDYASLRQTFAQDLNWTDLLTNPM